MATLVTCFFDLQKREGSIRKDAKLYLQYGKWTCDRDVNMIIFCDPEYVEPISQMREKYKNKTKIFGLEMEKLPYFQYYNLADTNNNFVIAYSNPTKDTTNYRILQWSKLSMLKMAIDQNPFGSDYFIWQDFGIVHVASMNYIEIDKLYDQRPEKIRHVQMRARDPKIFSDLKSYYSSFRWYFGGGFIFGPKDLMGQLCNLFENELKKVLELGICPNEDQILAVVEHQNPNLFDSYVGDFSEILDNYLYPRKNIYFIILFLQECLQFQTFGEVVRIGKRIVDSVSKGTFGGNLSDFHIILIIYYKASCAVDQNLAREIANLYVSYLQYKDFKYLYLRDKNNIDSSFASIGIKI